MSACRDRLATSPEKRHAAVGDDRNAAFSSRQSDGFFCMAVTAGCAPGDDARRQIDPGPMPTFTASGPVIDERLRAVAVADVPPITSRTALA